MPSVRLRILRFDPSTDAYPRYDTLELSLASGIVLLAALQRLRDTQDATLAFRDFSCPAGPNCGSCLMTVNGQATYACSYPLRGGEELTVEPLAGFPIVRDLVVDFGLRLRTPDGNTWSLARGARLKRTFGE